MLGFSVRVTLFTVLIALGSLAAASAGDPAGGWDNFRGPDQNGAVEGAGVFEEGPVGLAVDWSRPLGKGYSGIAVVDGRLITLYSDGEYDRLVALDADTGEQLWQYSIDTTYKGHDGSDDGPISSPTVRDGIVYALGPKGQLFALRLDDGQEVWKVEVEQAFEAKAPTYGYTTVPVVVGDVLFVQTGGPEGRAFVALDRRTGRTLWSAGSDEVAYQSPVVATVAGRQQIVAAGNKVVSGIDPVSGEVLWSHGYNDQPGEGSTNPVVIEGDRILLTTARDAVLLRLRAGDDGFEVDEAWRERTLKNSFAAPVYLEGHFYGFDGNFLTCVDAETGEKVWKSRPPGGHGLILIDDRLVIFTPDGELVVAKAVPDGYEEVGRSRVSERGGLTWPAFADGKIYLRNLDVISRVGVTEAKPEAAIAEAAAEPGPPAHRFEAFVREVEASDNKRALVDDFMNAQDGFPILEGEYVHFVYRGDAEDVAITGSMTDYQLEDPLERIEGTDLYHRSYAIEPGARWEYRFNVDFENLGPDPSNPRRVPGYEGDVSEVLTAGYRAADHVRAYRGDAPGKLETFSLESGILENEREVTVYLPAGYEDGGDRYPLLVVPGGESWLQQGNLSNSLNNLIGKRVAPLIAVFVHSVPQAAQQESGARSGDYVRMLTEELLPQLERRYRLAQEPGSKVLMGYATSTLVVVRAVLEHPEMFGGAAVQSPYLPGEGAEQIATLASEIDDVAPRFVVVTNRYELRREEWGLDLAEDSRRLVETLQSAGLDVRAETVLDSAGWGSWRAHAAEIFEAFFPPR
jgi:outer membrane protein assembly factor BamB/enterochelin esterase-like enzyme